MAIVILQNIHKISLFTSDFLLNLISFMMYFQEECRLFFFYRKKEKWAKETVVGWKLTMEALVACGASFACFTSGGTRRCFLTKEKAAVSISVSFNLSKGQISQFRLHENISFMCVHLCLCKNGSYAL